MKLSYAILYVNNIAKSVDFYQKAFGLDHKFTHEGGDYAEMDTGATTLAFCNHSLADSILKVPYQKSSINGTLLGSQITLTPSDVKKAYKNAIDCGAVSISEPETKPWNFEVAIVRDCDGHIVELAKDLNQ